jgi:hypothetical protein
VEKHISAGHSGSSELMGTSTNLVEVRTNAVHLVDETHAGDFVLVGLAPHSLRLRLDTGNAVEDGNGTVEDTKGALHLQGEVNVTRSIDDVDTVVVPKASGRRRGDGDATLLLLGHPVHGGTALVNLANFVRLAGVIEDTLGGGGLSGVNVGHDTNVAVLVEGSHTGSRCAPRLEVPQWSQGTSRSSAPN